MTRVTITVNGSALQVDPTKTLIEELIAHEVSVPHFCYHESLGLDGNCRMCMVEIIGEKRPQIACNTPIKEGMEVSTTSDSIMQVKRSILELELINHPVDCPICDQAGECSLQEYYMEVGLNESRIDIAHKVKKNKHVDLGSNVILDQERCVLCTRCTRFTANITHTHDLVVANRGNHACISTFADTPLEAKGYAMNVVDLCPVGALTSKDFRFSQRVWFLKSDKSICHGCSKGCNIYIDHNAPKYQDSKIYRFRPRKNLHVNGHFICDTGRLSYKKLNDNRLTLALANKRSSTIETGLKKVSKLLKEHHGKVLILISASLSLENMVSIKSFAHHHDIRLFGAERSSVDESFADDMLKRSDLAANRMGLTLLGINDEIKSLDTALTSATLILNFDNQDHLNKDNTAKQKWVHFTTHKLPITALQIPIKPFSEQQGMIISGEGILQRYQSHIEHSYMLFDIPNILDALAEKHYTSPNTLQQLLIDAPIFKDLDLSLLDESGIRLERKQ